MSKKINKYKGYTGPADVAGVGKYFGLARPFDLKDHTNRVVALITVLAFCAESAWMVYQGVPTMDACMAGLGVGLSVLFSYVLGMELDPDRKLGGLIGGVLAIFWAFWQGEPNFMVMLLLIFVQRMLNRTSGDIHKILDNLLLLVCAWWLGQSGGWLYPMMLGAAYILESQLPKGCYYSLYLAAMALGCLWFSTGITHEPALITMPYMVVMGLTLILFLPMLRMSVLVEARGDRDARRLDGQRLRAANFFFLMSVLFISFFQGNAQAVSLAPAMFTAIGVGVYLVYDLGKKQRAKAK